MSRLHGLAIVRETASWDVVAMVIVGIAMKVPTLQSKPITLDPGVRNISCRACRNTFRTMGMQT